MRHLSDRRSSRRVVVAFAACVAAMTLPAVASADRNYSVRFTQNAQGDITGTGNTLLTCNDSDSRCTGGRAGQGSGTDLNNNGLSMRYVDVDSDPATFDSSAATLALPAGARVLFAGLYYGGRSQAGSGGQAAPHPDRRNQVLFRPPNLGSYLPLTAAQVDDAPVTGAQTFRLYQGFVDVTGIVRAAGPGEYTVANVQLGTGLNADQSGGWALAIAYEDSNQPTRNLTIFDGFKFVLAAVRRSTSPSAGSSRRSVARCRRGSGWSPSRATSVPAATRPRSMRERPWRAR